jgi:hypothetical protein
MVALLGSVVKSRRWAKLEEEVTRAHPRACAYLGSFPCSFSLLPVHHKMKKLLFPSSHCHVCPVTQSHAPHILFYHTGPSIQPWTETETMSKIFCPFKLFSGVFVTVI